MTAHVPHPFERKLWRLLDRMGGLYTPRDILDACHAGEMQMHAEGDSIVITKIGLFPRARVLEVIAAIGDIDQLRILHDRILAFADRENCSVIQAFGRKGWIADAKSRGWKVKARAFVYQREM